MLATVHYIAGLVTFFGVTNVETEIAPKKAFTSPHNFSTSRAEAPAHVRPELTNGLARRGESL